LHFIESRQEPNGSFPLQRFATGEWVPEHGLFSTVTVLLAVGDALDEAVRRAALDFVRDRRTPEGYWHFDGANRLPADADDCACALACLALFDDEQRWTPEIWKVLSAFVAGDGRIRTWLEPASSDEDRGGRQGQIPPQYDDLVVVANVIFAVGIGNSRQGADLLARWRRWRIRCGTWNNVSAPYYPRPGNVEYAWLRVARQVGCRIEPRPGRTPERSSVSLAFAALCGRPELAGLLANRQRDDGSWDREPWCAAPGAVFGSKVVSSAFAVEALSRVIEVGSDASGHPTPC
jgi:hypothetical protein